MAKKYEKFDMVYTSICVSTRIRLHEAVTGKYADNLKSARQEARASYDAAWETFEKQFEKSK